MSDRLLKKHEVAAMLGTTTGVAASILEKHGIKPVDFGYGRSRGLRWLESAILDLIQLLHWKAQPQPAKERKPRKDPAVLPRIPLHKMKMNDVYELTRARTFH